MQRDHEVRTNDFLRKFPLPFNTEQPVFVKSGNNNRFALQIADRIKIAF